MKAKRSVQAKKTKRRVVKVAKPAAFDFPVRWKNCKKCGRGITKAQLEAGVPHAAHACR